MTHTPHPIDIQAEARAQTQRLRDLCVLANQTGMAKSIDRHRDQVAQLFVAKINKGWVPKKGWATPTQGSQGPSPSTPALLDAQTVRRTIVNILATIPPEILMAELEISPKRLDLMKQAMS